MNLKSVGGKIKFLGYLLLLVTLVGELIRVSYHLAARNETILTTNLATHPLIFLSWFLSFFLIILGISLSSEWNVFLSRNNISDFASFLIKTFLSAILLYLIILLPHVNVKFIVAIILSVFFIFISTKKIKHSNDIVNKVVNIKKNQYEFRYTIKLFTKIIVSLIIVFLPIYFFIIKGVSGMILSWITLLLAVVALFGEKLINFYFSPELKITVSMMPKHFHEADAHDKRTGEFIEKQAWLGIRVKNVGIGSAKNVEVYFSGLESNVVKDFDAYKSIPLIRSWICNPVIKLLPPNVGVRWDICYLREPAPDEIRFCFLGTPNALFPVKCASDEPTFFKFEVVALADNAKTQKLKIKIEFKGQYKNGFKAYDY